MTADTLHARHPSRPPYQLALEALVFTAADELAVQRRPPAHRQICQLCREARSVGEIAALLALPLGVVRILIADLAEAGDVTIHQPDSHQRPDGAPDAALLSRVLTALCGDGHATAPGPGPLLRPLA
ncbi:DUF742 domain-containing protein [Streptomyces sp. NPDC059009]|uniref:DUF742 domain-containing protein n=1 Tax=Streptomyces sp. NPDC059009 TaxID=3346694 RepID=UPI0036794D50